MTREQRRREIQEAVDRGKREPEISETEGENYSIRGPGDVVLSGPLLGFKRKGRRFASRAAALAWAQEKYGRDKVYEVAGLDPEEEMPIWAVVVKNLRRL